MDPGCGDERFKFPGTPGSWNGLLRSGEEAVKTGTAVSWGLPGVGWSWGVAQCAAPFPLPGLGSPQGEKQRSEASDPGASTHLLCDLGQVTPPLRLLCDKVGYRMIPVCLHTVRT